jgi:carboxyl-terminal processing protease
MNDYDPPRRHPFPSLLLLLLAFVAGVYLDRKGWIPGRPDGQPPGLRKTFAPFWEAWDKVEEHFVDRDKVDARRMTEGAIAGMIHSLGDVGHTSYLTKEARERLKEGLAGHLEGIGASLTMTNRRPTIVQTMPRSPARAAGLLPGDVLAAVDGQDVNNLSLNQVVTRVRGKAGTRVKLRILRAGRSEPLEVSVTRAKVDISEVSWRLLPGGRVAHLALQRFSKEASKQIHSALEEIRKKGAKGLILDLRGNQGGLKEQATEVASEFLPEGKVVFIQQDARGQREEMKVKQGGAWLDLPMVVLIDGGSASSSEILAGALQDHQRAALVGTRTFGTGTVLREYPLSDGSAVLLAIYLWLTPQGRQIWHVGISPDKGLEVRLPATAGLMFPNPEVELTKEALEKSDDTQLRKAIEVIQKKLR